MTNPYLQPYIIISTTLKNRGITLMLMPKEDMKKYDLHTHTRYSKCSANDPKTLLKIAKKRGLDGIAITDHHTLAGGKAVKKLNKDPDFEVIPGIEISTNAGDVLLYYADGPIQSREFHEVVDSARKQDALVIIPHPFRSSTNKFHQFKIPFEKIKKKIDAVECFNARMLFSSNNEKAEVVSNKLKIAKTGGSDGHFYFEIGTGYTLFKGSLRAALKKRSTRVGGTIKYGAVGGIMSFVKRRLP